MTTYDQRKNLAAGVVLTAPVPATTGVTIILQAGQGAFFPAPPFNATLWPANTVPTIANAEFVRVTAVVGDTLTITRAQQASTGKVAVVGFQIAETWTALDLQNIERVLSGKILNVNGTTGSNTTGLPYLTIKAAVTAAAAGDTIIVYPGTYVENNLMKAGITIHLMAGVIISYADAGGDPSDFTIFDDRAGGAAGVFKVTGEGQIVYSMADPAAPGTDDMKGAVNLTNVLSDVEFHFQKMSVTTSGGGSPALIAAIWVKNCLLSKFYVKELSAVGAGGSVGIYWEQGEMHCQVEKNVSNYYPLYAIEPVGLANTNLYYRGNYISGSVAGLYTFARSNNYRVWFDCLFVTSGSNAIACVNGFGRIYVRAQKLEVTGASPCIVNSAILWLEADKVSAGTQWIDNSNTADIRVLEFEDTGSITDGIKANSGTLIIHPCRVTTSATGAGCIKHLGGVTRVKGVTIDGSAKNLSTNRPVVTAAAGLILEGCTIIACATCDGSVYAATAQTVKFYNNSYSNKAKHANVTIQANLGTLVVDAAVS